MKKFKFYVLILILIAGIGLGIWGYNIMYNYNDFGDPSEYTRFKDYFIEARRAALPQLISGIIILIVAYIGTYIPIWKE